MKEKQKYKGRIHYVDPITGNVIVTKSGPGQFSRLERCTNKTIGVVNKLKRSGCEVIAWEIWDAEKRAIIMNRMYKNKRERTTPLTEIDFYDIL